MNDTLEIVTVRWAQELDGVWVVGTKKSDSVESIGEIIEYISDDQIDGLWPTVAGCLPIAFSLSGLPGGQHVSALLTLILRPCEWAEASWI